VIGRNFIVKDVENFSEPGMWKRLNFCGSRSTLKKEAGSESIFHKTWAGTWKRLNFCGSGNKNILLPHPCYEHNTKKFP